VRFHADENVSEAVAQGLLRRGFDITTTNEVGLRGATDEEQSVYHRRPWTVASNFCRPLMQRNPVGLT
jgi:Domain of unknown function (DUF5615)